MIDALETEFKKSRNETYETYQLLSRKQFNNESLEQFHSVLSGLAALCNFGTLEDRMILRDVYIVNMNNREAQEELCRSTKTPEEVYRIALSYERGNNYASSYVATGSVNPARCPANKIGHFERTCRGKRGNQRRRGAVGMIRENVDDTHLENSADEEASQHASSIGWINKNPVVQSWDSRSSDGDNRVMAIKHK